MDRFWLKLVILIAGITIGNVAIFVGESQLGWHQHWVYGAILGAVVGVSTWLVPKRKGEA